MLETQTSPIDEMILIDSTQAFKKLREAHLSAQDWQREALNFVPLEGSWFAQSEQGFDLDEEVNKFLSKDNENRKVLLLLGDSGAGKSLYTQGLANRLWQQSLSAEDPITLWISLPSLKKPVDNLIPEYLKQFGFTEAEIIHLQENHSFIFILDAYDEIRTLKNLYVSNQLSQWKAKIMITCRREYLYSVDNYKLYFVPFQVEKAHYHEYTEMIVRPFKANQIQKYLQQYIKNQETEWKDWQQYEKEIEAIPGLKNLIATPFMLKLAVEVLPKIVDQYQHTQESESKKYGSSAESVGSFDDYTEEKRSKNPVHKGFPGGFHDGHAGQVIENSAVTLFFDEKALNFQNWYHPEICHYLLQMAENKSKCIRVMFHDANEGNNTKIFKNQLLQLVMLSDWLKRPALFISKEPGADNHFICGLLKDGNLLLINPLGMTEQDTCYQTLVELKREKTIKEVWISSNSLQKRQYEAEGLVSCGPITLELATHILTNFTPEELYIFWENHLKTDEPTTHDASGLTYYGMNIRDLLSDTLKELTKATDKSSYASKVCGIRQKHCKQLQALPVERANNLHTTVEDYLSNCKEGGPHQLTFNALITEKKLNDIDELPAYQLLKQEINTQPTKSIPQKTETKSHKILSQKNTLMAENNTKSEKIDPQILRKCQKYKQLTQADLYDVFIEQWFNRQETKLKIAGLIAETEDIKSEFWDYAKRLAQMMHAAGITQITYEESDESDLFGEVETNNPWKVFLTPENPRTALLQTACLVRKINATQYAFIHDSLLEYFLTRKLYENLLKDKKEVVVFHELVEKNTLLKNEQQTSTVHLDQQDYFNQQLLVKEYNTIQFLADRVDEQEIFKQSLFEKIIASKNNPMVRIAAANAITVLNCARVVFSGMDFAGIQIPEADLAYSLLDHTNFSNADLCGVILKQAYMRGANFTGAFMKGIVFSENPFLEYKQAVTSVSYSNNDSYIAIATGKKIFILDKKSEEQYAKFEGHNDIVNSIVFSPDSKLLLSGSQDGTVRLWNIETRKLLHLLKVREQAVNSVAFSQDGKFLAAGCGSAKSMAAGDSWGSVWLWDMENINISESPLLLEGNKLLFQRIKCIAFRPNSKILAAGSRNEILLWSIENQKNLRKIRGHNEEIECIAFSPDGRLLASGGGSKKEYGASIRAGDDERIKQKQNAVHFWDMQENKFIGQPLKGHTENVTSMMFSVDGKLLITGSDDFTVRIWDVNNQCLIGSPLGGHKGHVTSVAISLNAKQVISGGKDYKLRIWEIETQKPQALPELKKHSEEIKSLTFSSDGKTLISGGWDGIIRLWDVEGRKVFGQMQLEKNKRLLINSIAISSNNKEVVSGSSDENPLHVWDIVKHKPTNKLYGHEKGGCDGVRCVTFSHDGNLLASVGGILDRTILLWDTKSWKTLQPPLKGHKWGAKCVAFNHNGRLLASAGSGSKDISKGKKNHNFILLWDIASHQLFGNAFKSHKDRIQSIAFSPDGKLLASGSWDKNVILWDVASQKPIGKPLKGHTGYVESVSFTPDGKLLASAGADKCVLLWLVSNQQLLQIVYRSFNPIKCIQFSRDGNYLAIGDGNDICLLQRQQNQVTGYYLTWSTGNTFLVAEGVELSGVQELSIPYLRLLGQLGAQKRQSGVDSAKRQESIPANFQPQTDMSYRLMKQREVSIIRVPVINKTTKNIFIKPNSDFPALLLPEEEFKNIILSYDDLEVLDANGNTLLCLSVLDEEFKNMIVIGANLEAPINVMGSTLLHQVTCQKYENLVTLLIQNGANIEAKDKFDQTPLQLAFQHGHINVANVLLQFGANKEVLNKLDENGETVVHIAARNDDQEIIALLAEMGVNLEIKNERGLSPLCVAIYEENIKAIKALLAAGVDVKSKVNNIKEGVQQWYDLCLMSELKCAPIEAESGKIYISVDSYCISDPKGNFEQARLPKELGVTGENLHCKLKDKKFKSDLIDSIRSKAGHIFQQYALHALLKRDRSSSTIISEITCVEIAKELIKYGADIEARDEDGCTPLHIATLNGYLKIIETLLQLGANSRARESRGCAPIHIAVYRSDCLVLKSLVNAGVDLEIKYEELDATPLTLAFLSSENKIDESIISHLLKSRADIHAKDKNGNTILHKAAYLGKINATRLLIKYIDTLETKNHEEMTPLFRAACYSDNEEIVKLLVDAGADVNANNGTQSVIHRAVLSNDINIFRCVLEKITHVDIEDIEGNTPLYLASENENLEMMKMLIEKGANINHRNKNSVTIYYNCFTKDKEKANSLLLKFGADKRNCEEIKENFDAITIAYKTNNFDKIIDHYRKIINLDPELLSIYKYFAYLCFFKSSKESNHYLIEETEKAYKTAIKFEDDYATRTSYAIFLCFNHRYHDAIASLRKAIKNKNDKQTLGLNNDCKHLFPEELRLEIAAQGNITLKTKALAYYLLIHSYKNIDQLNEAIKVLPDYIKEVEKTTDAFDYALLGYSYKALSLFDESYACFIHAVELNPDSPLAKHTMEECVELAKGAKKEISLNYEDSDEELNQAITLSISMENFQSEDLSEKKHKLSDFPKQASNFDRIDGGTEESKSCGGSLENSLELGLTQDIERTEENDEELKIAIELSLTVHAKSKNYQSFSPSELVGISQPEKVSKNSSMPVLGEMSVGASEVEKSIPTADVKFVHRNDPVQRLPAQLLSGQGVFKPTRITFDDRKILGAAEGLIQQVSLNKYQEATDIRESSQELKGIVANHREKNEKLKKDHIDDINNRIKEIQELKNSIDVSSESVNYSK